MSPKKTVVGAIGGLCASMLAAVLAKLLYLEGLSWAGCLLLAVPANLLGQVGDLAESMLKRSVGVKPADSSSSIANNLSVTSVGIAPADRASRFRARKKIPRIAPRVIRRAPHRTPAIGNASAVDSDTRDTCNRRVRPAIPTRTRRFAAAAHDREPTSKS